MNLKKLKTAIRIQELYKIEFLQKFIDRYFSIPEKFHEYDIGYLYVFREDIVIKTLKDLEKQNKESKKYIWYKDCGILIKKNGVPNYRNINVIKNIFSLNLFIGYTLSKKEEPEELFLSMHSHIEDDKLINYNINGYSIHNRNRKEYTYLYENKRRLKMIDKPICLNYSSDDIIKHINKMK